MKTDFFKLARNYKRDKARREEARIRNRLSRTRPDAQITLDTRDILNKYNKFVVYDNTNKHKREVYKNKNYKEPIKVTLGYDTLQYIAIVRKYIQRKHGLHLVDLELLLFLFPIGIWCEKDYIKFPHSYNTKRVTDLIKRGLVENIFEDRAVTRDDFAYRLSNKSKKIVRDFYEYLNREKTIPETKVSNPFFDHRATRGEMKVAQLIARLNQQIRGSQEKTVHHQMLDKRISRYHKQKIKERTYQKVNALQIRIQKQREERERIQQEKAEKLKDMQNTLSSYVPE